MPEIVIKKTKQKQDYIYKSKEKNQSSKKI